MPLETIYTVEEIADHLHVPVEAVKKEIARGTLRALKLDEFIRIRESDFGAYLSGIKPGQHQNDAVVERKHLNSAQDFTFTWPDGKVERFTSAKEGVLSYTGREHHVKLGFTVRNSAGKPRRRSLILVDRYATVEFVSKDTSPKGSMASIIKDRHGKQLPVGAAVPAEYAGLPTGPYRDVVKGPGASNGLAVICDSEDFEIMVTHALIRYKYRQERI